MGTPVKLSWLGCGSSFVGSSQESPVGVTADVQPTAAMANRAALAGPAPRIVSPASHTAVESEWFRTTERRNASLAFKLLAPMTERPKTRFRTLLSSAGVAQTESDLYCFTLIEVTGGAEEERSRRLAEALLQRMWTSGVARLSG